MRIGFYIFTLLAAGGIYVSELLIDVHLRAVYRLGGADSGLCGAEGFSCAEAANSQYAELFGLPIAALGMGFYIAVLILVGLARFMVSLRDRLADVFVLGGLVATAYSVFLAVVSAVDVGAWCPLCLTLYGINLGLFLTAGFSHPEGFGGGLRGMLRGVPTIAFAATVGVLAVSTVVVQGVYAHRAKGAAAHARQAHQQDDLRTPKKMEVASGESPSRGPADAPLTIIEFSDFQCPYCARLADSLKAVSERMGGKVRYVFKHFPMDPKCNPNVRGAGHAQACDAAVAMVCAERMGKGWAMHDLMFENQRQLGRPDLKRYAAEVGVDPEALAACLDDASAIAVVRADIEQGVSLGVPGTPVWFLNGWRQVGARSADDLQQMLEDRLRTDGAP